MLPKKLHLDEINRFHDKMDELEKRIDSETDERKKVELSFAWYKLNKHWSVIDDAIENTRDTINNVMNGIKGT